MDSLLVVDGGTHSIKYATSTSSHAIRRQTNAVVNELPRSDLDFHSPSEARCSSLDDVKGWLGAVSHAMGAAWADGRDGRVGVVVLMHALTPRRVQEVVLLSCFEQFEFVAVALGCSASAALCAGGEMSGVAVDIGYSGVRITPVCQGMPVKSLCASFDKVDGIVAATALPSSATDRADQQCEPSRMSSVGTSLPLPDGTVITLDDDVRSKHRLERDTPCVGRCRTSDSFAHIYRKASLLHRDVDCWTCHGGGGGASMISELLAGSLARDIRAGTARHVPLRNPTQAAVEGGVIWSQLSSFKNVVVDVDEYMENGPERCVQQMMLQGW